MKNSVSLSCFTFPLIIVFTSASLIDLRLREGNSEYSGLIEINFNSVWYTVCNSHNNTFTDYAANLICNKIIGAENATSQIYLDLHHLHTTHTSLNIHCHGSESDLSQCKFELDDCFNSPTAGVVCRTAEETDTYVATLNNTCKEDRDFKCNTGVCIYKAWICDGENDCEDGEDEENCTNYLENFEKFEHFKPINEAVQTWQHVTLTGCASKCAEEQAFSCVSFSFRPRTPFLPSLCLLSNQIRDWGLNLKQHPHFDYYEKLGPLDNTACNFTCANGACVSRNKICDGNYDCSDGSDEKDCEDRENLSAPFAVRIVNGSRTTEGRVEVRHNGRWGVICDDFWTLQDANIVCKEIGFPEGAIEALTNAHFGSGNGQYLMDDVTCDGSESSISQCKFNGWEVHDCFRNEAAGVICSTSPKVAAECDEMEFKCDTNKCVLHSSRCNGVNDCVDGSDEADQVCNSPVEVRIVNGPDNLSGRVEVRYREVWGTICDDNWDEADAQVVCRSLGHYGDAQAHKGAKYGAGTGPIWLDDVHCSGLEFNLEQCEKSPWLKHNCNHKEDAAVTCTEGELVTDVPKTIEQILPSECGEREIEDETKDDSSGLKGDRIVGGLQSEYGAHPWQVGVRINTPQGPHHYCGGTIISEFFVLSAAHCFQNPANVYIIRSGDFDNEVKEEWEQEFLIDKLYVHENYDDEEIVNDIALIKIQPNKEGKGFQFNTHVGPACLPSPHVKYTTGTKCFISGWGNTGNSAPNKLKSAVVPILPRSSCSLPQSYGSARLTPGMFCAGEMAGGTDSCQGDSGGPFVCKTAERYTLFGIVSWGHGCALPNKPGIYTTVRHYLGWIYEKLLQ